VGGLGVRRGFAGGVEGGGGLRSGC
jgi:hypothetical protein